MDESKKIKEKFDVLYEEWQKVIQDPKIQISSRPRDYINNEPYREIIRLGKCALPFILEKIAQGNFLMNQAAIEVSGLHLDKIVENEIRKIPSDRALFLADETPQFLSEQQKSELILKYAKKTNG